MPRYAATDLPHYHAALRADASAHDGISQSTYERRLRGVLPPVFRWLLARPHLVWALYLDACAKTGTQPNEADPIEDAA